MVRVTQQADDQRGLMSATSSMIVCWLLSVLPGGWAGLPAEAPGNWVECGRTSPLAPRPP